MKVFLCGARGFVGQSIQQALERAGHQVVMGVSSPRSDSRAHSVIDFKNDTNSAAWLPRLAGVQAVVNAVGVLRDSAERPIEALHHLAPKALFDACFQLGIERVIQISALGVDENNTQYALTKRAADEHLLHLARHSEHRLHASVLRPSIVFGRRGARSQRFRNLASLPVLVLPTVLLQARVQPIAVTDLADTVAALLERPHTGVIECTGPEPVSLRDFTASLRTQRGHSRAAHVLTLPAWMARWSARVGDFLPASVPWCTESLSMLSNDNVAKGNHALAVPSILGRPSIHYSDLVQQVWHKHSDER